MDQTTVGPQSRQSLGGLANSYPLYGYQGIGAYAGALANERRNMKRFGGGATGLAQAESDTNSQQGMGYLDYFDTGAGSASAAVAASESPTGYGTTGLASDSAANSYLMANQRRAALIAARRRYADQLATRSSGYGSGSGYGGGYGSYGGYGGYPAPSPCTTGLNPLLTLLTLAGVAVGAFLVFTKLTGGRSFKDDNSWGSMLQDMTDYVFIGMFLRQ